jgi:hypothetical protein
MNTKIVLAFVCVSVGVISAFPYPGPYPGPFPQLQNLPKAGPNGYNTKNYFQYTNVAAPDVFEWG